MPVVSLEGTDIIEYLRKQNASGTFLAEIPDEVMQREFHTIVAGTAQLTVQQGNVVACSITTTFGDIIEETGLGLEALKRIGVLCWQMPQGGGGSESSWMRFTASPPAAKASPSVQKNESRPLGLAELRNPSEEKTPGLVNTTHRDEETRSQQNGNAAKSYSNFTLGSLVSLLHQSEFIGTVEADLPAGSPGLEVPCHLSVTLGEHGKLSCHVMDWERQRVLRGGQQALQLALEQMEMDWVIVDRRLVPFWGENNGSFSNSLESALYRLAVPKCLHPVEGKEISRWSRLQRRVFGLVDGLRDVQHIAFLLARPSDDREFWGVLLELQALGVITFDGQLHAR